MTDHANPNGNDAQPERQRPSWYVPVKPIPDDGRTTLEVLVETWGTEPPDVSDEVRDELLAYLDQFGVPRES